jgi:hypothetical protein
MVVSDTIHRYIYTGSEELMKRIAFILIAVLVIPLSAQDKKGAGKADDKKTVKDEKKINVKVEDGFEGAQWNKLLSEIRTSIKGRLLYTDEKTILVSRDGEVEYTYGFFYIEPEKKEDATNKEKTDKTDNKADEKKSDEGKLFYVAIGFPYVPLKEVRSRLEKYGDPTDERLVEKKGVIAWNGNKTIIMMWVDQYRNESYCRRIVYVSKDIIEEVKKEKERIFRKTEREVLEKLDQLYGKKQQ